MVLIRNISPLDDMFQGNIEHYFHVGDSAIQCIMTALSTAGKNPKEINNILDFPCGYGRVLRYLRTTFPEANISACDLDRGAVDFCAETFGARPVYSDKNVSNINISGTFDLIWVGSLFTHLDLNKWGNFIDLFNNLLNPGGLLIITLHGPQVLQNIISESNSYGLNPKELSALKKQYVQKQFGYVNYPNFDGYGISISTPANSLNIFRKYSNLEVISYHERAWDDHQDAICCQKKVINSKGSFTESIPQSIPFSPATKIAKTDKPGVIFCLPEGLTLGGVTTWAVELSRGLKDAGLATFLGVHPSRYNNPPVDFGITESDHLIDCTHLPHPDDPNLKPGEYLPLYEKALPGVLIPSWSWGTYALAALFASKESPGLRVIGMAHSDESGYYQWLVHYEAMIHKFLVANTEIRRKLSQFLPHRFEDILVKPAPVNVPVELIRTYSLPEKPLQIVYGGRIAQYQKRVFELIDLINALVEEGVNFNFRIIGGGADKDEFYEKVNRLPEKTRALISLEDSLALSKLPELWRSNDINVMISDFEGVSNSMLMGMAEGCVPVMTEVSGTVEVITSGVDGYLVPVGDMAKMARVIKMLDDDRALLVELGKNAYKKVDAHYSQKEYNSWFAQIVRQVWEEPVRPWPPARPPAAFQKIHQEFVKLNYQTANNTGLGVNNKKTKILFLSHDPNWGGAPKVMYSLIKGLDRAKWMPVVALPEHGNLENEFSKIGVETVITPMKIITTDPEKYWQQYINFNHDLRERTNKVVDIIFREQIDIVATNTVCIFEGALAAKFVGIPHIWYVHELSSKDDQLTPLFDFSTFYATMDSLSEKIVVISKAVQNEINQFFPSRKFAQIYTGLEDISMKPASDKSRVLGISSDVPVITFLGVISKRKGVLDLVETANLLIEKYPQIKFVIAGKKEGETYNQLQKLITDKRLENQFQFLGFRNDIHAIIASSDIVIIPSLVEPFSLVALEAMQLFKPVIATKSGGPEEIIIDGDTGILVPVNHPDELAKAISGLLENPELMKSMGQKGRQRYLDYFNYEPYIAQFERLLDEVMSKPRPKNDDGKIVVENFLNLAAVATNAKTELGSLGKKEDPNTVVDDLLNYPVYHPFKVAAVTKVDKRPKVSICVPIYNGSDYIRDSIDSILFQTYKDFELILVNDASTDNTREIIQSYTDPRIKYFENDRNLGLVGNWNKCLELSVGEFVCIFHQDDIMTPGNIEKKVTMLDSDDDIGLVFSDTLIINQKGEVQAGHWFNLIDPNVDFRRPGKSFFELMFVNLNLMCCPSVLVRRACYEEIGGFDDRLPFSCDMEMWMRISLFYDVAYLSQPYLKYRFHDTNVTNRYLDLDLIHVYLCKKHLIEKYPEKVEGTLTDSLIKDTTHRVFERAQHHYNVHQLRTAKQYLYFLEKIRDISSGPELIDFYIKQLRTYVNQANAIDLLLRRDNDTLRVSGAFAKSGRGVLTIKERLSKLVNAIKPYIPSVIKKPLKSLREKLFH